MLREQTPFEIQRERVLRRDNFRCWGTIFFPDHECTDLYGMPCRPDAMQTMHVLPKHGLGNWIDGLLLNPRMTDHPCYGVDKDAVLYDPRCALCGCPGIHRPWDEEGKDHRPRFDQLPPFCHAWARDYGILERLRSHYN